MSLIAQGSQRESRERVESFYSSKRLGVAPSLSRTGDIDGQGGYDQISGSVALN
ncbi:hypothetical protein NZK35_30930 [Stieleria sp. ICT_E10.1]|uniref:hypothetical protein n=1 Tax=Stieleria sedimenti TaxID=2976331 RepID=UPI00217F2483|nr:hypothetical protein [Stieleria sedimenti]MCS7471093.1 hypothetical protein [Stieleria sedimenti]